MPIRSSQVTYFEFERDIVPPLAWYLSLGLNPAVMNSDRFKLPELSQGKELHPALRRYLAGLAAKAESLGSATPFLFFPSLYPGGASSQGQMYIRDSASRSLVSITRRIMNICCSVFGTHFPAVDGGKDLLHPPLFV
jgi:hypothetical protein